MASLVALLENRSSITSTPPSSDRRAVGAVEANTVTGRMEVIERLHQAEVATLKNAHLQLLATKDQSMACVNDELQRLRATANPPDALSDLTCVGKVGSAVKEFVPGLGGGASEPASTEPNTLDMLLLARAKPIIEQVARALLRFLERRMK